MNETRMYSVSGRVQGVWYRKYISDAAIGIGIKGWTRNTSDGKVEVLATGNLQQQNQLQSALWTGSPMSAVKRVNYVVIDDAGSTNTFEVL